MFQFILGCVTKQRPDTLRNWGVRRTPRGVAGAWPGRAPGREKPWRLGGHVLYTIKTYSLGIESIGEP